MIEYIYIDIYLNFIVIASGIDEVDFDKLYHEHEDKFTYQEYKMIRDDIANPNSCNGLTTTLDNGNIFVFIRKGQERKDLTVAHEIFHAAHRLLLRAGVKLEEDGEAYAYLIGWLTNEYYNRLNDYEENQHA